MNARPQRYGIDPKTVAGGKKRVANAAPMGPKEVGATVLTPAEEAAIFGFVQIPPLYDCPDALPPSIPPLTRSSLHRCLQRHGQPGGDQPKKQKFATYPIGDFHIAIAEGQTEEGKLDMFVTVDRPAKFVYAEHPSCHAHEL